MRRRRLRTDATNPIPENEEVENDSQPKEAVEETLNSTQGRGYSACRHIAFTIILVVLGYLVVVSYYYYFAIGYNRGGVSAEKIKETVRNAVISPTQKLAEKLTKGIAEKVVEANPAA